MSRIRNEVKRISSEISACERAYEQYLINKATLQMDWKIGKLDDERYFRTRDALELQIILQGSAIYARRKELENISGGIGFAQSDLSTILKYRDIMEIDRSVLEDLVDVIYVQEGGKVEVMFCIMRIL